MVQVYQGRPLETWKMVLFSHVDKSVGTDRLPGSNGHKIVASLKDMWVEVKDDLISSPILELIGWLEDVISDAMDNYCCGSTVHLDVEQNQSADVADFTATNRGSKCTAPISTTVDGKYISVPDNTPSEDVVNNEESNCREFPPRGDADYNLETIFLKICDKVEVYWPLEFQFYPGVIDGIFNGRHQLNYDNGNHKSLNLAAETWRLSDSLHSLSIYASPKLTFTEQMVLQ